MRDATRRRSSDDADGAGSARSGESAVRQTAARDVWSRAWMRGDVKGSLHETIE